MRYREFTAEQVLSEQKRLSPKEFGTMMEKFLVLAVKTLDLKSLPKIILTDEIINAGGQPSFGMYINDENILYVALTNRNLIDILRTMAHELTHYKQDIEGRLNPESGRTGSSEENEAHAMAGIIMRNFTKQNPEYMNLEPL